MKNTMKFGVEIEYKSAKASKLLKGLKAMGLNARIKGYHPETDFTTWDICSDSSVSYGYGNNMTGGELVSPILTLADIDILDKVCKVLSDVGATVDYRCGLHIHFSWTDMDGQTIKKIIERYSKFENEFDAIMSPSRRTTFCSEGRVDRENSYARTMVNLTMPRGDNLDAIARAGRRENKINLRNIGSYSRTGTLEFRHHNGTIDALKIKNWVLFLADFIQESKKKVTTKTYDFNSESVDADLKRKAYGSLKGTMAHFGIEMKQNRGFGFTFINNSLPRLERLSYAEVDAMYISGTRILNEDKLREFVGYMTQTEFAPQDTMFCGVEEKLTYYYMGRRDMFTQRRA